MQVTYPSHHRWQRSVLSDPLEHLSHRTAGKIRTAIALLPTNNISYTIEPLTEKFLDIFLPLYTTTIEQKDNAIVHDVAENTLGVGASRFPYYALSLHERETFLGGTIFSLRPDRISFAYRIFLPKWQHADIKISPAYIGEYAAAVFAHEHAVPFISHGRDRNPYGLNADIGLATFKLSAGCKAYVPTDCEIKTINTTEIKEDCLILEKPKDGTAITKAYLVTSKETEQKYLQVTKYPNQLAVEVLYRD